MTLNRVFQLVKISMHYVIIRSLSIFHVFISIPRDVQTAPYSLPPHGPLQPHQTGHTGQRCAATR